jgi:hypothetical protein
MKTNDYVIPKMSLNEVAEKTSIPKYKLTYRLSHGHICERRLKSAARGGRKVQRWGWVESTPG